jgi:hypothetical protein
VGGVLFQIFFPRESVSYMIEIEIIENQLVFLRKEFNKADSAYTDAGWLRRFHLSTKIKLLEIELETRRRHQ